VVASDSEVGGLKIPLDQLKVKAYAVTAARSVKVFVDSFLS
jgi:hypothetical protein